MPIASPLWTVDFEQLTVSSTVKQLTLSKRRATPLPEKVIINVFDAPLRWRADGTDPDANTGNIALPGGFDIVLENRNDIENFKAIRQGTSDAEINVSYQRSQFIVFL